MSALAVSFLDGWNTFANAASRERLRINQKYQDGKDQGTLLQVEADRHWRFLHDKLGSLGKMAKDMTEEDRQELAESVGRSDITDYYHKVPCVSRAFYKPCGYAGDSKLMDMFYRNDVEGTDPFEQVVHKTMVGLFSGPQAVRNRIDYLKQHIASVQEGGKILSMAAGPALEVKDVLQENPSTTRQFLALDHDPNTLRAFAGDDPRLQYAIANAFHFIKGWNSIAFPRKVPFLNHDHQLSDFKGISALLAPLHYKFTSLVDNSFDLIYSAGLYDYILNFDDPQKGCKALTTFLFSKVKPGGKLVIGNFNWSIPDEEYCVLEFLADWKLLYRDDDEIKSFVDGIEASEIGDVVVEHDATGVNSFLVVTKVG
jgi:hypothetical protein